MKHAAIALVCSLAAHAACASDMPKKPKAPRQASVKLIPSPSQEAPLNAPGV